MVLNGSTLPNTVYISLNSRPKKGEYHWGIVITDANNTATLYHASNRSGPWQFQARAIGDPGKSMTLIVLVKVGTVSKNGIAAVIQQVPADGKASKRNGEAFSCRTWVKDALAHLVAKGNIVLKADVGECRLRGYILAKSDILYPLASLMLTLCPRNTAGNGQEVRCQVRWQRRAGQRTLRGQLSDHRVPGLKLLCQVEHVEQVGQVDQVHWEVDMTGLCQKIPRSPRRVPGMQNFYRRLEDEGYHRMH
ncbi:hypothetical protein F5144DRAFT_478986 [Chaetomium tenue]|uniref:Uncharacterized protein n=1 Tax=Chaetomium tenue TaxID=1854479 RepID=A0ACB7PM03_9PEZI|nr:hypothetical protein F5144DRAFT_478986 [Chaetomium globosum]